MKKELLKYALFIGLAVLILWAFNSILKPVLVSGDSMYPTYKDGSLLSGKDITVIKDGDVVIAKKGRVKYIKRVVGTPGDTLVVKNKTLFVNDKKINTYEPIDDAGVLDNELTLKEDEYFLMGDNVNNSMDSRSKNIGLFSLDNIIYFID